MIRHFSWVYKRSMFVKLYVTMMYQCVYGNLISIMLRIVYLAEPPYGTMLTGTDHQPAIHTQASYFQCFKKDKAIQCQHKPSNFLPRRQ